MRVSRLATHGTDASPNRFAWKKITWGWPGGPGWKKRKSERGTCADLQGGPFSGAVSSLEKL